MFGLRKIWLAVDALTEAMHGLAASLNEASANVRERIDCEESAWKVTVTASDHSSNGEAKPARRRRRRKAKAEEATQS